MQIFNLYPQRIVLQVLFLNYVIFTYLHKSNWSVLHWPYICLFFHR
ncbi:hypothetical protein PCIT_a3788 [Pseudoalteromonas citrea]|uniref:Uncharacterized protein n=1 Tax=Pseudoalteromonas citrea TaxID=43655 RepID=A0AAD4AGA0_9GAMM|nr:hypothetical protein PCIT_a3788 [Pseudoalteromonas citrea]